MSKTVNYKESSDGLRMSLKITPELTQEYVPPTPLRVAELAEILTRSLRDGGGDGMIYASLGDKNGDRRIVVAIAEYDPADANTLVFEALEKISDAITDDKPFRVEVDE